MKFYLTFFFSLVLTIFSFAQNATLEFDGINDYIDLGPEAGNGVRTIEMWFKLEEAINPQLNDFMTLAGREISATSGNTDEFTLSFQPFFLANPGTLRFDIDGTAPFKSVYSDNNTWNADEWYHVAAVVDPVQGMLLFINGVQQESTHPYTGATGISDKITTIGSWGNLFDRFFEGEIDNVRFSVAPLYSGDFSPDCNNSNTQTDDDVGIWNFNENEGQVAVDSSANNYDGNIVGPIWKSSTVCGSVAFFDGIDDYIDLGPDVGNKIRTIEMWFKLKEVIDPQLDDFVTLVGREISATNGNTDEFTLSFQPSFLANAGRLRFDIDGTVPVKSVYSDNNTWNADEWYHVAAVVDPVRGMLLFIDGVQQESTHPYTGATGVSDKITTIGSWGNLFDRFFEGEIDNVRFSEAPLYSADFSTDCAPMETQSDDVGLWNFNENFGSTAIDLSGNSNHGEFVGASRVDTQVCPDSVITNIDEVVQEINQSRLNVYPNPSSNVFYFEYQDWINTELSIMVFNGIGQIIIPNRKVTASSFEVNLSDYTPGIYFYEIRNEKIIINTGKLIKN